MITVPLTDEEQKALDFLAAMQELSPERVMIQALRMYQLVIIGGGEIVMPKDENPKWRPITEADIDALSPF